MLWTMDKTVALTGERRHRHKGGAVAPLFIAPELGTTDPVRPNRSRCRDRAHRDLASRAARVVGASGGERTQ
jgi:hypothetical protein